MKYSRRPTPSIRRAYTLLEIVISLASASLLVAGLASSVLIATKSFDGTPAAKLRSQAAEVQTDILNDLSEATSFSNRAGDSVTFKVPDRDGDQKEETITYSWDSGSGEFSMSVNGGAAATLLEDVTDFQLDYYTRFAASAAVDPAAFDSNDWGNRWQAGGGGTGIVFEEFTEAHLSSNGFSLGVDTPCGTNDGDLLVVAVVVDHNNESTLTAPPGWNLIVRKWQGGGTLTLGVWWKIASAEPANQVFSWGLTNEAYGWMMRFTGHHPSDPIHTWAIQTTGWNETYTPPSPAVTTSVANALILRLGGFDDDDITIDVPGLPSHTAITMDESGPGAGTVSGGAGYFHQPSAGDSGASTFTLVKKQETVAVTIAIAPIP